MEETKFLKRKSVDTFNAKNPRQSHYPPHKTDFDFCRGLFYIVVLRSFEEPRQAKLGLGTFFQDFWSESFYVIARAKARSNTVFGDLARSEIG